MSIIDTIIADLGAVHSKLLAEEHAVAADVEAILTKLGENLAGINHEIGQEAPAVAAEAQAVVGDAATVTTVAGDAVTKFDAEVDPTVPAEPVTEPSA
jgi:hypothetical protein